MSILRKELIPNKDLDPQTCLDCSNALKKKLGLIYFGTTKFESDANRPFRFQQL